MFQTDGPLMRAQQPAFQQRDDPMDARQQFRRVALAAQDRDLTSVAFAVEGEVAQPTIRMYHAARRNRLLHEGHQTARRSVRDATHANASDAPALFLCRHDNQCLALRFAAPHALFRGPHVSLVNLDSSRQLFPARPAQPEKIVTTGFLRSEAPFEVRQRARIVFHGLLHYLLWLPESNGYPLLHECQKKGLTKFAIVRG